MSHRTDYDAVAPRYDSQPFRSKNPDPLLREFLDERGPASILDVSCGTGNQLAANLAWPEVRFALGLDASRGMLEIARGKSANAAFVQASGDLLPFRDGAFDYVSHQYAFHHIPEKARLVREVFRVLRPRGRFVLSNISPRGMRDAALYRYFPESLEQDLLDFPEDEAIAAMFRAAGFSNVSVSAQRHETQRPFGEIAAELRDKSSCSELTLLSDEAWQRGLALLDAEMNRIGPAALVATCWCLLSVRGDRGA